MSDELAPEEVDEEAAAAAHRNLADTLAAAEAARQAEAEAEVFDDEA